MSSHAKSCHQLTSIRAASIVRLIVVLRGHSHWQVLLKGLLDSSATRPPGRMLRPSQSSRYALIAQFCEGYVLIVLNAQIISCSGYESNACENTQEGGGNFYDVINLFQQNAVEIMTDNLFSFSSGKNGSIPSCPIDAVGKVVVSLIIRSCVLPLHLCLLLQISGSFFIPRSEHIMASILAG